MTGKREEKREREGERKGVRKGETPPENISDSFFFVLINGKI